MVTTKAGRALIMCDPLIHGGEPVVRGTRVPIRSIVLSLQVDYQGDRAAVAAAYQISAAAVEAALEYYQQHRADIDRAIAQHEQAAYDH